MSSLLICSTPVHGHVTPLLAVTRALVAGGHEVRFLTGERYRDAVEAAGATFVPLPREADFDDREIDRSFPGRVGLTGPAAIRYDMIEIFLRPMKAQAAAVREALDTTRADAVLAEPLFAGILGLVVDENRPPIINLGIVPLGVASKDTAPFGLGVLPKPGAAGRARNAMMRFVAEKIIFGPVQKFATQQLLELTGKPMPGFFLNWMSHADAIVQFTVPSFEYPRSDLPATVHFVGPVSTSAPNAGGLPEWWGELDGSRPVVHVSQGTVANQDYEELILPTIRGLANDDVLVVVSTGGRAISTVPGIIPANVRIAEYLPYDELLPRTDVVVTNGGYGGVHFALAHGVPLVVAGMTEDKTEVSARIEWTGTGINLRTNRPTDVQVGDAVRRVLAEPSFALASARIGVDIAESPGAKGILPIVRDVIAARAVR